MTSEHKSTRLGDLLVERKIITHPQLLQAIELQQTRRHQAANGGNPNSYKQELGEVLIELGFIDRGQLKFGLGWQRRIRKTTAVMVFIAPLLTAACGGGGGGSGSNNNTQAPIPSSLSASSDPVAGISSSSVIAEQTQTTTSQASSVNAVPVTQPPLPTSSSKVSSSRSSAIISPVISSAVQSSSNFSSKASNPTNTSSAKSSLLGASSSSVVSVSSSSATSLSSTSALVSGPVQVYWTPPNQRENGDFLDITELGGYELRYKRKLDVRYKSVIINDSYTDAYYFDNLEGDYEFQIAAFDNEGVYSSFVPVKPM